jgi:hypothetical protein
MLILQRTLKNIKKILESITQEGIYMQGLGLAIGATLLDIKKATTLASVTVMTFMLAGGFFVKVRASTIHNY